jgi:hypothetical protein
MSDVLGHAKADSTDQLDEAGEASHLAVNAKVGSVCRQPELTVHEHGWLADGSAFRMARLSAMETPPRGVSRGDCIFGTRSDCLPEDYSSGCTRAKKNWSGPQSQARFQRLPDSAD